MDAPSQSCRTARRTLAQAIRQLGSGLITNGQFEDRVPGGGDRAVHELYEFVYCFYDDLYEHRLRGPHRLSPLQRQVFARCVLFLRTDLPYEWPDRAKWIWCRQSVKTEPAQRLPWWKPDPSVLASLPIFGFSWLKRWMSAFEAARDRELKSRTIVDERIWPFRTRADYKAALREPAYLAG